MPTNFVEALAASWIEIFSDETSRTVNEGVEALAASWIEM